MTQPNDDENEVVYLVHSHDLNKKEIKYLYACRSDAEMAARIMAIKDMTGRGVSSRSPQGMERDIINSQKTNKDFWVGYYSPFGIRVTALRIIR